MKIKLEFIKKVGSILLLGSLPYITWGQISVQGTPESFMISEKSSTIIPFYRLDSIHPEKLKQEDFQLGITNRYGQVQPLSIDIKEKGVVSLLKGKGTIWRYQISAPEAVSLGIQFSDYHLPEGASLFIYDGSKKNILGAFTSQNNKEDRYFAISDLIGNEAIVEYYEPDTVRFSGEVTIGSISIGYRSLSETAVTSQLWINCPEGDNWQTEKNSVCLISFIEGRYSYICSGSLINNVRGDGTPYFLTANHCISSNTVAKTVISYFNYENQTCDSNDGSKEHTLSGATLKANGNTSDFSLLQLNETPPDAYKPYYAGWDATVANPTSGAGIHHPDGNPKAIAIENDKVVGNDQKILWDGNTLSGIDTHWSVYFDKGYTEQGSSGSPFFNQNKRIVGQLHGGENLESYYGKFSISWANSSLPTSQLKKWLDPDNTGTLILDGLKGKSAPKSSFASQMKIACTNNPVQLTDKSWYSPTHWLWKISPNSYRFVQGTDSITQNPIVEFMKEQKYSIKLVASNSFGADSSEDTGFIDVRDSLPVELVSMPSDTSICGCNLASLPIIANGAYSYRFNISDGTYINSTINTDTLSLTLKDSAKGVPNIKTTVYVTGSHGSCVATDSLTLDIIQQKNDDAVDAIQLKPGRNGPYSNHCGTVETAEVSPPSGNCYSQVSWCSGESGSNLNNSVWFTFNGPTIGKITIDTHGFDDQIAIYKSTKGSQTFTGFSDLEKVAANDNRSPSDNTALIENLKVDAGAKYWIQMDGRYGVYGNAVIDLITNSAEVYPTVSGDGKFTVYITSENEGTASYNVYNTLGQRVIGKSVSIDINSDAVDLDLSGYPKGVYLLSVTMGDIKSVHRIVSK